MLLHVNTLDIHVSMPADAMTKCQRIAGSTGVWLVILFRWHVPTARAPPFLCLPQIYNQADGSYMGSPEMSPLYSIVNALTQTGATITLICDFLL